MEQPEIQEFIGDSEDDGGMNMLGQFIFGLFFFAVGLGSGWLIWG